jgi:nucleotide sugar dehydrogenase
VLLKVAIIGLGFVGLSFAVVLSQKNFPVLGIDIDQEKILKIKKNIAPFFEPKLNNYLRNAQKKSLQISDNLDLAVRNYDLIFITVSTPSLNSGAIDLKFIKTVIVSIGKILEKTKNKPIIIIKSTVIPQSSLNILLPLLEKYSKKSNGKDFGFITNPEFLREGNAIDDTINPHIVVVGGSEKKHIKKMKKFYSMVYKKDIPIIITNYLNAEVQT